MSCGVCWDKMHVHVYFYVFMCVSVCARMCDVCALCKTSWKGKLESECETLFVLDKFSTLFYRLGELTFLRMG